MKLPNSKRRVLVISGSVILIVAIAGATLSCQRSATHPLENASVLQAPQLEMPIVQIAVGAQIEVICRIKNNGNKEIRLVRNKLETALKHATMRMDSGESKYLLTAESNAPLEVLPHPGARISWVAVSSHAFTDIVLSFDLESASDELRAVVGKQVSVLVRGEFDYYSGPPGTDSLVMVGFTSESDRVPVVAGNRH